MAEKGPPVGEGSGLGLAGWGEETHAVSVLEADAGELAGVASSLPIS